MPVLCGAALIADDGGTRILLVHNVAAALCWACTWVLARGFGGAGVDVRVPDRRQAVLDRCDGRAHRAR